MNQVYSKKHSKDLYPFGSVLHELDLQIYLLKAFLKIDFGVNTKVLVLEIALDDVNILSPEHVIVPEKKSNFYRLITVFDSCLNLDSNILNHTFINTFLDRVTFVYNLIAPFCKESFYYNNKLICILDSILRTSTFYIELINLFTTSDERLCNCKFKILDLNIGVEFLGWIIRLKRTGELTVYPTGKRWLQYKEVIKLIFMDSKLKLIDKVYRLRCLSKYWKFSNQLCDTKKNRSIVYRLRGWCLRYLKKYTALNTLERLLVINYIF